VVGGEQAGKNRGGEPDVEVRPEPGGEHHGRKRENRDQCEVTTAGKKNANEAAPAGHHRRVRVRTGFSGKDEREIAEKSAQAGDGDGRKRERN